MTRLCIDCRWFGGETMIEGFSKCCSPLRKKSLVNGEPENEYADMMRSDDDACGPLGKWWESEFLDLSATTVQPRKRIPNVR